MIKYFIAGLIPLKKVEFGVDSIGTDTL